MPALLELIRAAASVLRARLAAARRTGDAGYTTETVVVTALLVALAIAAIAIIVAKVIAKANGLNLG
jgi:Na+-driven multidrug efflux pump